MNTASNNEMDLQSPVNQHHSWATIIRWPVNRNKGKYKKDDFANKILPAVRNKK